MNKNVTIIQPGRLGDIIITLPIAHNYHLKGFDIIWPVANEYIDIFRNVNFLSHMFIYNVGSINERTGKELKNDAIKHSNNFYIDLAIGFGDISLDQIWKQTSLSFDLWKYNTAGVPYPYKYNLSKFINRDLDKEEDLKNLLNIRCNEDYIVIHENGSHGRYFDFSKEIEWLISLDYKVIKIKNIEGYNIFDWLLILQDAYKIYCVDSCIANLVDQFNIIPPGGRYFHSWKEYYNSIQLKLLTPCIKNDWILI